jgi:hypothetical protein
MHYAWASTDARPNQYTGAVLHTRTQEHTKAGAHPGSSENRATATGANQPGSSSDQHRDKAGSHAVRRHRTADGTAGAIK